MFMTVETVNQLFTDKFKVVACQKRQKSRKAEKQKSLTRIHRYEQQTAHS